MGRWAETEKINACWRGGKRYSCKTRNDVPWYQVLVQKWPGIPLFCCCDSISIVFSTIVYIKKKWKYTPAVRWNILSKLIFASCVWFSDRAYYGLCVLITEIGRRLPLQLQCSYQGQQSDVRQSVRENDKNPFPRGTKSDSCGRKCIRLSSGSCNSNNLWREGGGLMDVGAWFWSYSWVR